MLDEEGLVNLEAMYSSSSISFFGDLCDEEKIITFKEAIADLHDDDNEILELFAKS